MSKLEEQIAAAKARRNARIVSASPVQTTPKPKRVARSAEQKIADLRAAEELKQEKRLKREQLSAAKKAEREAARRSPHMNKAQKAIERLPELHDDVRALFAQITDELSLDAVKSLAMHLNAHYRVKRTEEAVGVVRELGDCVRIISGDNVALWGCEGVVTKAQRIRCYVDVGGTEAYLFTSETELLTPSEAVALGLDDELEPEAPVDGAPADGEDTSLEGAPEGEPEEELLEQA